MLSWFNFCKFLHFMRCYYASEKLNLFFRVAITWIMDWWCFMKTLIPAISIEIISMPVMVVSVTSHYGDLPFTPCVISPMFNDLLVFCLRYSWIFHLSEHIGFDTKAKGFSFNRHWLSDKSIESVLCSGMTSMEPRVCPMRQVVFLIDLGFRIQLWR